MSVSLGGFICVNELLQVCSSFTAFNFSSHVFDVFEWLVDYFLWVPMKTLTNVFDYIIFMKPLLQIIKSPILEQYSSFLRNCSIKIKIQKKPKVLIVFILGNACSISGSSFSLWLLVTLLIKMKNKNVLFLYHMKLLLKPHLPKQHQLGEENGVSLKWWK